jgi:hypothetical protein
MTLSLRSVRAAVGLGSEMTAVRDSKDRDGAALTFDARAWASFLAGIRADGSTDRGRPFAVQAPLS